MISAAGDFFLKMSTTKNDNPVKMINFTNFSEIKWTREKWLMISAAGENFWNFNQKMINFTNFLEITWTCEKWLMTSAAGEKFWKFQPKND